jgi:hypothetical protein
LSNKTFAPTTDITESQKLSETKMLNNAVKNEHMPTGAAGVYWSLYDHILKHYHHKVISMKFLTCLLLI